MADWLLWIIALFYLGLLFTVAFLGDRSAAYWRSGTREPLVYALSLAVYCTTWTFYGGVGRSVSNGLDFTLIYVGPILVVVLGYPMMRKIIRVARMQNITSVADFIAARYGKSRPVAALATVIALVGVLPYIALQLQAVSLSFGALATGPGGDGHPAAAPPFWADTALYVALTMAVFAILFGVRHVQANERHQGMILAIAFESLVKLGALVAAGAFVTFIMFDGPGDLTRRLMADDALRGRVEGFAIGPEWISITVMSALAFICLPRQFHVAVVEAGRPADLNTARWLFPAYLGAINIFVPAIAVAGMLTLGAAAKPDLFVLSLPVSTGQPLLSLAVFLGGLSAATGMVIVETVALATMISNELVIPLLLRGGAADRGDRALGPLLLRVRRIAIFAILLLAYAYYALIGGRLPLASIGLIAFCAVAQLGPALVAGLYWRGAHRHGAFAGMMGGFLVWLAMFLVPSLTVADETGPLSLFGTQGLLWGVADDLDALTRGAFWSLSLNTVLLIGVSLVCRAGERDRQQADAFVLSAIEPPSRGGGTHRAVAFDDLKRLVGRFVGAEKADHAFAGPAAQLRDRDLADYTERLLSGAIGAASARIMVAATIRRNRTTLGRPKVLLREASEAILFNRDLLSATLETISQGIGVFDRDLGLAAWNGRFVTLLGLAEAGVQIGLPLEALAGAGGHIDLSALLREQRDDDLRRVPHSHERRSADGRVLELQTNPMPDGGFVLVATDVTDRVQTLDALRDSERRIRIYTDNVPVLIAYVDQAERYRFTNRPYEQALRLERGQAFGLSIRTALGEDRYHRLKPYVDAALAGRRQVFEIEFAAAGAELARGTYIPHLDEAEQVVGFYTLYEDITEQRRAEAVLRETAETLERRVAERTRELTELNEALGAAKAAAEAANLGKTRFLAAASHDLLQPFHAARLLTATLGERLGRRAEAPLVRHIDRSLGAVEELLQALLEISKLDAGALQPLPRPVAMAEVLLGATMPFEPMARRRNLGLRVVPSALTVETDPLLIRRIVQNFVSNAMRYTRNGRVLVGCRRRGGQAVIQVWDTGPGIAPDQLAVIFEEFRRLEAAAGDEPAGLGLGLAIVDRIARMLGHEVAVRSWPGRGSVFEIALPFAAGAPPAVPQRRARPLPPAASLAGRTILCIDNDQGILTATRALLEQWGCTVLTAANAGDAHAALLAHGGPPDAALLDYHLGDSETGLDALDALARALGIAFPAVLVTADRSDAVKAAARGRGLVLLHKPLKPAALRALLVQMLAPPQPTRMQAG